MRQRRILDATTGFGNGSCGCTQEPEPLHGVRDENYTWSFGGRNGRQDFAPGDHDGSKEMLCRREFAASLTFGHCSDIGTLPAMSLNHHRQPRNDVNKPESKSHQGQRKTTRLRASREMLTPAPTYDFRSACGVCLSVFSLCHKLPSGSLRPRLNCTTTLSSFHRTLSSCFLSTTTASRTALAAPRVPLA